MNAIERETIILFNEEQGGMAECFTYNVKLKNRLDELSKTKEECNLVKDNGAGGLTYTFPKKWVRIKPPAMRAMTDEQKEKIAERLRQARQSK